MSLFFHRIGKRGLYPGGVLLSGLSTLAILLTILLLSGAPRRIPEMAVEIGGPNRFRGEIANALGDALADIAAVEKRYWISRDAPSAPKPDPSSFGETEDPQSLSWIPQAAEKLLSGQQLYFAGNVTLLAGTPVRYYLDDTILALTWKQPMDDTVYTFSEVKIADPSQFRRYLAGGEFGSGKLMVTTEMAASVNAVVASSGDFYQYRNAGIIVYDGIARRVANGMVDTCYIDNSGNMHFTRVGDSMDLREAQSFVDANGISFSVAFGPVLVEEGRINFVESYRLGEVNQHYARAALCQLDDLHYLLVTANSEGPYTSQPTIHQFARRIQETDCRMGYALDGGQTAVIAMNGERINNVTYGYQRKISDILYFGTAIPD